MKFSIVILAFFACTSLFAQSLEGSRIFTATLGTELGQTQRNFNSVDERLELNDDVYSIRPQLSYGRINHKNILLAYGIATSFYYKSNKSNSMLRYIERGYGVGPIFSIKKFIALNPRLYYTPALAFYMGYEIRKSIHIESSAKTDERRYNAMANFTPIGLTYVVKPKLFFLVQFGDFSLNYLRSNATVRNISGMVLGRNKTNDFGLHPYYLSDFSFGIQKVLGTAK